MQADVGWVEQELNEVRGNCRVLEAERDKARTDYAETQAELRTAQEQLKNAQTTIVAQREKIHNLERGYGHEDTPREKILRRQISDLEAELSNLKKHLADEAESEDSSDFELVEWFEFLQWFKPWIESKPKKGNWTPTKADVKAIYQNVKKSKPQKND